MTRFYNWLAAAAVILTPVAMMTALGWAVYAAVLEMTGIAWLAVLSGLATAAALEAVGIVAGETVLWFHGRNDRRWLSAAAVLVVYVVVGLLTLRATPLGLLPILAGAVHILVGLRAQAQRETANESAQAVTERAWEQEQWRIRQADRTAVKLAEVQAKPVAVASTVQASTNGASKHASSAIFACKQCASTYPTMQALGAHVRHAHGKVGNEAV